jgi:hypothetical protein
MGRRSPPLATWGEVVREGEDKTGCARCAWTDARRARQCHAPEGSSYPFVCVHLHRVGTLYPSCKFNRANLYRVGTVCLLYIDRGRPCPPCKFNRAHLLSAYVGIKFLRNDRL